MPTNQAKRDDRVADFGYEQVPWGEKKARVRGVFDSVASRYDLMNDAMSGGLHRLWKRFTIAKTGFRPGQQALDVAAGSGDLAVGLARRVGRKWPRRRHRHQRRDARRRPHAALEHGLAGNIDYVLADAESLPFKARTFHCVTIGFGLRNVTDKERALTSLFSVSKPGGRLLVLEFSHAHSGRSRRSTSSTPFKCCRGSGVARRRRGELPLSRRVDPPPPRSGTLKGMMERAGFERCEYFNFSAGMWRCIGFPALKFLEAELNRWIGESTAARELLAR